jgi:hypothetical protein
MEELKMSEELNLDEKVVVKNLCDWDLHFARIEAVGDIEIKRKGTLRLTNGEIQSQINATNTFFTGTDGKGSHAKVLIDSKESRIYFGFESEDGEDLQFVLNTDSVKALISLSIDEFSEQLDQYVVTQAEKLTVMEESRKLKLNDHEKIKILEDYTGYKFVVDNEVKPNVQQTNVPKNNRPTNLKKTK